MNSAQAEIYQKWKQFELFKSKAKGVDVFSGKELRGIYDEFVTFKLLCGATDQAEEGIFSSFIDYFAFAHPECTLIAVKQEKNIAECTLASVCADIVDLVSSDEDESPSPTAPSTLSTSATSPAAEQSLAVDEGLVHSVIAIWLYVK